MEKIGYQYLKKQKTNLKHEHKIKQIQAIIYSSNIDLQTNVKLHQQG